MKWCPAVPARMTSARAAAIRRRLRRDFTKAAVSYWSLVVGKTLSQGSDSFEEDCTSTLQIVFSRECSVANDQRLEANSQDTKALRAVRKAFTSEPRTA